MASIYQDLLASRRDMTDWLIHFTRASLKETARERLLRILVSGVLRPGFAKRGERSQSTIYGKNPAVCFTEQPIESFLCYLKVRRNNNAMSGYGVLVHKHYVYAAGGLPVIYGLGGANLIEEGDPDFDPERRLLGSGDLPYMEQYRYVAFAPNRHGDPLDWSHEREWRWSANQGNPFEFPAFPLGFAGGSSARGYMKPRIHAFVDKEKDIQWIQRGVKSELRKDDEEPDTRFEVEDYSLDWRKQIKKVKLISLERARTEIGEGNQEYATFDTWPESSKFPLIT